MLYLIQYPGGLIKIVASSVQEALDKFTDKFPNVKIEDAKIAPSS